MFTRRELVKKSLMFGALASTLPLASCGKATDVLNSLRSISKAVENAIDSLVGVTGLLPPVVHDVYKYLTAVANFVLRAGEILENEKISNADKASQILGLVASVVVPTIANTVVAGILAPVTVAFNIFTSLFKGGASPSLSTNSTEIAYAQQIETEARVDKIMIRDWVKDTLGEKA